MPFVFDDVDNCFSAQIVLACVLVAACQAGLVHHGATSSQNIVHHGQTIHHEAPAHYAEVHAAPAVHHAPVHAAPAHHEEHYVDEYVRLKHCSGILNSFKDTP